MTPVKVLRLLVLAALAAALTACGAPAPTPTAEEGTVAEDATAAPAPPTAPGAPPAQATPPAPAAPAPASAPASREPVARPAGRTLDSTPAPAPTSTAPAPEPRVVTLPAGTGLQVAFLDAVSSAESQVGDSIRARVTADVMHDGIPVIPAGSVIVGSVTEAQALNKRIGGKPKVAVSFDRLDLTSGRTAQILISWAMTGKSETKKDAATIGGATAGGALLGRVLKDDDKSKGTLIGAVVGAAAGTAIAAKTHGDELLIPVGAEATLVTETPSTITITP